GRDGRRADFPVQGLSLGRGEAFSGRRDDSLGCMGRETVRPGHLGASPLGREQQRGPTCFTADASLRLVSEPGQRHACAAVLDLGSTPLCGDQPVERSRRIAGMKITYLLTTADAKAGTERAIAAQAQAMTAAGHEVTVASVYRSATPGFDFGAGVELEYISDLEGPTELASLIIPSEWDNQFCQTTDTKILDYLGSCATDILVTTTPALTVLALLACPDEVKIVQEEHRNSISRGLTGVPVLRHSPRVDALVVLTERSAEWLSERWGPRAPRIEVIP